MFHRDYLSSINKRTTVIVLGDARNNYNLPHEWVLRDVQQRAKQVIWLNPESRLTWGFGDSEMDRYAPYCDLVEECRNLNQLYRVIDKLSHGLSRGFSLTGFCGVLEFLTTSTEGDDMAREEFIEMRVGGLTLDPVTKTPIVILKDPDNKLNLPIWIGLMEATAMATELEGIKMARPMTHDLLRSVVDTLGGVVEAVEVTDLRDSTYYAGICLE